MNPSYLVRHMDEVSPVPCPCGQAARIITGADNDLVSIHRVRIEGEAKEHYHKKLTEYYVVLSGSGEMELDGRRVPVEPGHVIMISPNTRHALRGHFEIINMVCPPFEEGDEYVVERA